MRLMRRFPALLAILLVISACSGEMNHAARKSSGPPTATPTLTRQSVQWGLIVQGGNDNQGPLARQLQTDSAVLNHRAKVVGSYQDWSCPTGYGEWNYSGWVTGALAKGLTPQISWYPSRSCTTNPIDVTKIASGAYNLYLQTWAHRAAALPGKPTIYIRLFEEFDSANPGYLWDQSHWNAPGFVAAWQHVYDIFQADGATNVKFIWDPGASIATHWTQAEAAAWFPGVNYVNAMGWDQYGNDNVAAAYKLMQTLAPGKPIIVPEFGGTDQSDGALKALFNGITSGQFPAITQIDYFDENVGSSGNFTFAANPNMAAFIKSALAAPPF